MYNGNTLCHLSEINTDTQEHILDCSVIKNILPELKDTHVKYKQIFGDIIDQKEIVSLMTKAIQCRDTLLAEDEEIQTSLPGQYNTGPRLPRTRQDQGS